MNKIKEGDYVRISDCRYKTKIARIEKILNKDHCYKNMQMYRLDTSHQYSYGSFITNEIYKEDIIKHSSNIIDLIKKGDFINGEPVIEKKDNELFIGIPYVGEDNFYITINRQEDIKSIVTKEQFKEMEYRVNE